MSPRIDRRTAWVRLVVALAEGLPAPATVRFHPDGDMVNLDLDTKADLDAWAALFGAHVYDAVVNDAGDLNHRAARSSSDGGWHGFYVGLNATTPAAPLGADDLSAVRALAAEDIAGEGGEVAGARSAKNDAPATGSDELVWVAAERKGIDYHADNGAVTRCGRSAMRGTKFARSEVVGWARPCPRCYPPAADDCPGLPLPVGDAVPRCGLFAAHHPHRIGESVVYRGPAGAGVD